MKSLTLIRHAKSDQYLGLPDHERPLNARGERAAPQMGRFLDTQGASWDQVFVSTARRAQMTADLLLAELDYPAAQRQDTDALYTFDAGDLFRFIEGLDDQYDSVALIAHNPAITLLGNELTRSNIMNAPTCSVLEINLPVSEWIELEYGAGTLQNFYQPKALADEQGDG